MKTRRGALETLMWWAFSLTKQNVKAATKKKVDYKFFTY